MTHNAGTIRNACFRPLLMVAAFLVFTGVSEMATAADTYRLVYKFKPGQVFRTENHTKSTYITQFNETKEESKNETHTWRMTKVVSIDEQGNAVLEPVVERVKMMIQTGDGEPITYDSTQAEIPIPAFNSVRESIGQPLARLRVSATGELMDVIVLKKLPGLVQLAERKDVTLNLLIPMPRRPVAIGESWNDQYSVSIQTPKGARTEVAISRSYSLEKVEGTVATIRLKSTIMTPINDPQQEMQLLTRAPNGTLEFDLEQGQLINQFSHIDRTVLEPLGAKTVVRAMNDSRETLLPENFKPVSNTTVK